MSDDTFFVTEIKFVPPPDTPTIRLTIDLAVKQAEDIRGLCHFIGGDPDRTTRGVFSEINTVLRQAGVMNVETRVSIDIQVYFKD